MPKAKAKLLLALCIAISVFTAVFVETSFGAEKNTFNLSVAEGNVYALMRIQSDAKVTIKNADVEHFTVQTAKDTDTNQSDEFDVYLIKTTATSAKFALPEVSTGYLSFMIHKERTAIALGKCII